MLKLVHEPWTVLVSRPQVVESGVCAVLGSYGKDNSWGRTAGPGESLCEFMGRLCYGSFGSKQGRKTNAEYMANILDHGHGSVLEHANYSFVVMDASRGYTHQMVRHRAGFAYSQESTHFVSYRDGATVCLPGFRPEWPETTAAFSACKESLMAYSSLYEHIQEKLVGAYSAKKAVCGTLRGVMPIALASRIGFTANMRALRHFCEMRGAEDNTVEIRHVACQVAGVMRAEAPTVFGDFKQYEASDGFPALSYKWRKV